MRIEQAGVKVIVPERYPTYPEVSKQAIYQVVLGLKRAHGELLHTVYVSRVMTTGRRHSPRVDYSYMTNPAPAKPIDSSLCAELTRKEAERLSEWLKRPNGAIPLGDRCTFEAVSGGGIYVRVLPYAHRRKERT